jgi:hypothetical protein
MANNFKLGSRCMKHAAKFALRQAVCKGNLSFSSEATIQHRWDLFVDYLHQCERGVKKMEDLSADIVKEYGCELAHRVLEHEMKASTAKNYVSAINSVMDIATRGRWSSVAPTRDCGIPERHCIREKAPVSLDQEKYLSCLDGIREELGDRAAIIVELCRKLGLRSKESSLLNAANVLKSVEINGYATIVDGTKGGRGRQVFITCDKQIEVLRSAANIQGSYKSLIPPTLFWRQWRERGLRKIREALQQKIGASGLHDLRAAFACDRYEMLSGTPAPVVNGDLIDQAKDKNARLVIAAELGHTRHSVVSCYCGGRKK